MLMPENDQQTDMQLVHGVFQRCEHAVVNDLPCGADSEHVAETGVKDDFRRHPGIRARQYGRVGALRIDEGFAGFTVLPGVCHLALGETPVAGQQTAPRGGCGRFVLDVVVIECLVCHVASCL